MLMKILKKLQNEYMLSIVKATSRSSYVFGQRIPNINDLKRTYTARLRALMDVAVQAGDEEAINFIQGAVDTDEQAIEADVNAIKAVKTTKK